jgi:hypothetical protein
MPNFEAWLGTTAGVKNNRAVDALQRIDQKPSWITIVRTANATSETTLAPQKVRIEYKSNFMETMGGTGGNVQGAGISAMRETTVFGFKDHPIEPDTDIQRDDQFAHEGDIYTVIDVITSLGEVQAKVRRLT